MVPLHLSSSPGGGRSVPGADQPPVSCFAAIAPRHTSVNYLLPRSPVPLEMHRANGGEMTATQLVERVALHLQLGA